MGISKGGIGIGNGREIEHRNGMGMLYITTVVVVVEQVLGPGLHAGRGNTVQSITQ